MQESKRPRLAVDLSPMPKSDRCQILAKKGFLSLKNITSDVALLLYSSEFQLGVLFHFPVGSDTAQESLFAKSAMTMILAEFETLGVRKSDLVTSVIGGSAAAGIAQTSLAAMRRTLSHYGLTLSASDLGGNQRRSIWMDVESGRTIIRTEPLAKKVTSIAVLTAAS